MTTSPDWRRAKAYALSLHSRLTRALLVLAIFHLKIGRLVYRDVAQPLSPCGICRQVIREFCALKMPILLVPAGYASADNSVDILETTVEGLLPHSFGPDALELPRTG